MAWIIGFLTFVLLLNCLLLVLLVLIQLPKKEAGLGTAFGGGATDALFGAGSGNALTKMTKYGCGIFFVLTLCLSVLNAQHKKVNQSKLDKILSETTVAPELPTDVAPPVPPITPVTVDTNIANLSTNGSGGDAAPVAPAEPVVPEGTPPPAPTDPPKN